ncbi:hypothetical protein RMSM_02258 [Rhodopirellula maiorica SM1]|uniref:Uncharacterized protein n=1 Tax=Rhodopirellula maiorica SM1 TaxID=1265738 RepID=M5RNF3_9BACT|nr:hypothetical protein RMSM_02258 [Rhodopirellula maiorica SM1]
MGAVAEFLKNDPDERNFHVNITEIRPRPAFSPPRSCSNRRKKIENRPAAIQSYDGLPSPSNTPMTD